MLILSLESWAQDDVVYNGEVARQTPSIDDYLEEMREELRKEYPEHIIVYSMYTGCKGNKLMFNHCLMPKSMIPKTRYSTFTLYRGDARYVIGEFIDGEYKPYDIGDWKKLLTIDEIKANKEVSK